MKKIIISAVILVFSSYMAYCFIENKNTYNIFTIKQEIIDEIVDRFDKGLLTEYDKKTINRIYGNIIFFGGIIYPEASKILKHYIFGDGEDMVIISKYFFNSGIIKNALNNNSNNEIIGPVTLKIKDDPRIAYAINGFYIKNNDSIEIYQEIDFANRNDRNTYTIFNIFGREIKIPDRLIRAFENDGGCNKFTVRIRAGLLL
jgi:hypothetical protein